ncbi:MAG: hypothetical protein LBD75_01330 [Candidatus Peribacteria bacterium]|jgi:hypothetical protein|nr:hypothetical protein [Candidatus Peribacteria bacterium]
MVNKQFVEPAQQLINDRREKEEKKGNFGCVYGCIQFAGVQCKEQKCITRTFLPSHASRPEKVDSADLERFRESPEDTREILQERRKIVDDYWNGVSYNQNCQLSDNGKYVICIETEESLSMNVPMGESTMTTLILTEAREKAFFE